MKRKRLSGFSLMEMMVVLLIIAVVAAASAPMISKKMINSAAQNSSPWVWTGTTNAIAFNIKNNEDQTVTIGDVNHADGVTTNSRLFIKTTSSGGPQIGFGDGSTRAALTIKGTNMALTTEAAPTAGNATAFGYGTKASNKETTVIGSSAQATNQYATAIGYGSNASGGQSIALGHSTKADRASAIGIGYQAEATGSGSIAIGPKSSVITTATGTDSIAIGGGAQAKKTDSIAIGWHSLGDGGNGAVAVGTNAKAQNSYSTALGYSAKAQNSYSTAIGYNTTADVDYSTAIGYGANTSTPTSSGCTRQIVLGDSYTEVYIPGKLKIPSLVIDGDLHVEGALSNGGYAYLAKNNGSVVFIGVSRKDWKKWAYRRLVKEDTGTEGYRSIRVEKGEDCDRRLKNVGEEITTGLEQIKQLKIYNFTYKKDENKTPHIGVIAQDLQKVFPNAVIKGEDGFLKIRWEDIFYSMVNAIKELDAKFEALVVKVQKALDLEEEVKALRAENKELKKQFSDLEKRIEKLEKKAEKRAKKAEKE